MTTPTLDELVLLPEPVALQRHFDAQNQRAFLWLLGLCGSWSLVGLAIAIGRGETLAPALFGLNVFLSLVLFAARQEPFVGRFVRQLILAYVVFQLVIPFGVRTDHFELSIVSLLPLALIWLRLRPTEHLLLFGSSWVATLWRAWAGGTFNALSTTAEVHPWHFGAFEAAVTGLVLLCLAAALGLTRREKLTFLVGFRRESARHRERQRMREEIDQARRVQLSMLPQRAPDLPWLEVAAASLPATEVGGDYYEFFPLGPSQLAAVIGDVAGHGLGSGLVLSGLRSCLFLLEDQLAEPVGVFERINKMVRRTSGKRSFVTLACAVIDSVEHGVRVVTAGHPPILLWSARERRVEEVGRGSPPLGTNLPTHFEIEVRPCHPGDLLVLYTDGLIEARDAEGRDYGDERLSRLVAEVARASKPPARITAREMRDAILGDLANFKGDCEQLDDMTVVVLRMR
ncbi:MAG TPA: PP2C family protein-serine/threonine phosphatase [Thermoanaerobaculia bacterium]|jgi:serine phosphatase RsbU (regulator of sigma subunit)|nr:PP2C family protein-serine/threonine phosphatase [Thermoanaerobaculia bacterium]